MARKKDGRHKNGHKCYDLPQNFHGKPKWGEGTRRINISTPHSVADKVATIARVTGKSQSEIVVEILFKHFEATQV